MDQGAISVKKMIYFQNTASEGNASEEAYFCPGSQPVGRSMDHLSQVQPTGGARGFHVIRDVRAHHGAADPAATPLQGPSTLCPRLSQSPPGHSWGIMDMTIAPKRLGAAHSGLHHRPQA